LGNEIKELRMKNAAKAHFNVVFDKSQIVPDGGQLIY
jgi:hypothetical protein